MKKEVSEIFKCTSILMYCYRTHHCFYSLLFIIAGAICRLCLWRCEPDNNGPSFSCYTPQLKYIGLQQKRSFPKNENSCTRSMWWKMLWRYQIRRGKKDFEKENENKEGKKQLHLLLANLFLVQLSLRHCLCERLRSHFNIHGHSAFFILPCCIFGYMNFQFSS